MYGCVQRWNTYGDPLCQHVAGPCLDAFVADHVLAALEPAALELSLAAAERVEQDRAELDRLWRLRRERAAHEADRAARQYHACEPENRLVARTLERAWEAALAAQQHLEEDYARFARAAAPPNRTGTRPHPPARGRHPGAVGRADDHPCRPQGDRPTGRGPGGGRRRRRRRLAVHAEFDEPLPRAAVDSALTPARSNGPVEGLVRKVKVLKRQGYGRAKLDLLRARVLAA